VTSSRVFTGSDQVVWYSDVVVSSGRMPRDGSQMIVKRMFMRKHLTVMSVGALLMWLGTALLCADGVQATSDGEPGIVSFARTAATQALTFPAGDKAALAHARDVFTEAGWSEFMKVMQGWVDTTGAPTFASAFVASGAGRIVDEQDKLSMSGSPVRSRRRRATRKPLTVLLPICGSPASR